MKYLLPVYIAFLLSPPLTGYGQNREKVKPLFGSDDILELKITMNVEEVIHDLDERLYHDATLYYSQPNGATQRLDIKVKVRGNTRANLRVCKFPPLKINLKKKSTKNTLFNGQNKFKLVTHCKDKPINEEYILREYYVYKIYQLISPSSLKVRLSKVVYDDTAGEYDDSPHYGFIIEDIDDLAKRNNMVEFTDSIRNQEVCQRTSLDRLMLFEYMIGNLDFSIPHRHNFKLIAPTKNSPQPIAVPYDFDYSGMVNTSYAKVPEGIDIPNVRTRMFRGLCRLSGEYEAVIAYFQSIKSAIYALYQDSPYLSKKSKQYSTDYLDSFYKIMDNPKQVNENIIRACRANHQHLYEY